MPVMSLKKKLELTLGKFITRVGNQHYGVNRFRLDRYSLRLPLYPSVKL